MELTITPEDITGVPDDVDVARTVFAYARSIAPCIVSLDPESDDGLQAIAILRGVQAEVTGRGNRQVSSQRIGAAAVTYRDVSSAFTVDDRAGLRALCAPQTGAGGPQGSFPDPSREVARLWPESYS